jgi:cell division transport system permease protein
MLKFSTKEAIKSIRRAKLAFCFSLISTTLGLLLIQLSVYTYHMSNLLEAEIKNQFVVNVFLENSVPTGDIQAIEQKIKKSGFIKSVLFISKDEAAKNFVNDTGENFLEILEFNPLPASFVVELKDESLNKKTINEAIAYFNSIKGVESVDFQTGYFEKVLRYVNYAKKYIVAITAFLFIAALYLIYSTLKLIIINRKEEIETMKLVGAELSLIKLPIIINGVLIGLIASILSYTTLYLINLLINKYLTPFAYLTGVVYNSTSYFTFFIGPVIGIIISILTVRKITLKI